MQINLWLFVSSKHFSFALACTALHLYRFLFLVCSLTERPWLVSNAQTGRKMCAKYLPILASNPRSLTSDYKFSRRALKVIRFFCSAIKLAFRVYLDLIKH